MLGLKLNHVSKRGSEELTVLILKPEYSGKTNTMAADELRHGVIISHAINYRNISNMSRTKSQNLNVPRLDVQLSLRNILKQSVKLRMMM